MPINFDLFLILLLVKVKFTLEQATKAQRGSRGIVPSFFNLSCRWETVVNTTTQLLYCPELNLTHCNTVSSNEFTTDAPIGQFTGV
jgi:hypothetical protein